MAPASESTGISVQPPLSVSAEPPVRAADHIELSVIAEDEEPCERAHIYTSRPGAELPSLFPSPILVKDTHPTHQETKESISDMDTGTFPSIPLDSPSENELRRNGDPGMQITATSMAVDSDACLPEDRHILSDHGEHPMDQIQGDNATITLSKGADKPQSSPFPVLPEPMPLRKSTRHRDPSLQIAMLSAATPGATAGKRTSWLAKAREVKALEGNGRKLNAQATPSLPADPVIGSNTLLTHGIKRKSETMLVGSESVDQEDRVPKIAKLVGGEVAPRRSKVKAISSSPSNQRVSEQAKEIQGHDSKISEDGVLDILKKTVQGLGVRAGKTTGSVGGDAATALAEAKAAAEARLAERDRREETGLAVAQAVGAEKVDIPTSSKFENRTSISDLFPKGGRVKEKHKASKKVFSPPPPAAIVKETEAIRLSTSTTPPNSPPSVTFTQSVGPVFTKLVPVFVPPIQGSSKLDSSSTQAFGPVPPLHNIPSSMVVGFGTKLPSPTGRSAAPLTTQSTIESVHSEMIFDHDDTPAWMPSTQNTEYTATFESQSQLQTQICDEDDSWPVDDKIAAGVHWMYGASKEDSMTWSTLPSQSQRADTAATRISLIGGEGVESNRHTTDDPEVKGHREEDLMPRDLELEEMVLGSKSTVNLVKVGVWC